ncbi:Alcohol dehydrogenase B [Microbacterium lemovicicum]|uniref:Alcohol dehydrogenase B n=1 Tax=Microbacterium lemovicicum TaxID=1072463 RepID=A0A3Q9J4F2_9MICO|nr:zinc-binding dehydrogenase [Microbacterium lemovicicum]AZS38155.1 Alcohol dehydrogenase B [Microbacterium lemovicicum]
MITTITGAVLERIGDPAPYADSRPLRIRRLRLDDPRRGELLVRIEAAGVCHSDLSVVSGVRPRPVPMLLGHEAAGIVTAAGAGTSVPVGARVVMTFLPRCEECVACRTGGRAPCSVGSAANGAGVLLGGGSRLHGDGDGERGGGDGERGDGDGERGEGRGEEIAHHLGVSAFADHAVVDERSVVVVDDDVPPDVAALMGCAVLTGGGAVMNSARLQVGESLIVVGLGGVGLAAVLAGLALGAGRVTAVDVQPAKLDSARALGAHDALTSSDAVDAGLTADVVVEAVGRASAFEQALQLTAPGGRTVTVGLPAPDDLATVSPLALVAEGRSIIGSYLGGSVPRRDIPRFVELWRAGRLPVEKLVSRHIGLGDINEAMDELAAGRAVRQVIHF